MGRLLKPSRAPFPSVKPYLQSAESPKETKAHHYLHSQRRQQPLRIENEYDSADLKNKLFNVLRRDSLCRNEELTRKLNIKLEARGR